MQTPQKGGLSQPDKVLGAHPERGQLRAASTDAHKKKEARNTTVKHEVLCKLVVMAMFVLIMGAERYAHKHDLHVVAAHPQHSSG